MWTSVLSTATLLVLVAGNSQVFERNYYEEIGCKPEDLDESGFPFSYDCSSLTQRESNKCYYKGQAYDLNQELRRPEVDCLDHCNCVNNEMTFNHTAFNCITVECPEDLGHLPPSNQYMTFELGKCCSTGWAEIDIERKGEDICTYKNKNYLPGQYFFPEEHPCLACVCKTGFNGDLVEPFCQKMNCNLELAGGALIAQGCIPIFFNRKTCCPEDWRCPMKNDTVVPGESHGSPYADSGKVCKFGDLTLRVGEKLNTDPRRPNSECSCRVPPHVVCLIPVRD